MEIKEAIEKAKQLLDEERIAPTVKYGPSTENRDYLSTIAAMAGYLNFHQVRSQHPRNVLEDAKMFKFESTNYELLCALLSQVPQKEWSHFVNYISTRLNWGVGCTRNAHLPVYPKWKELISELPLVVEFLVRNGGKTRLFEMLAKAEPNLIPGHMLLLLELEDLIAFNFYQFTNTEYEQLSATITVFQKKASQQVDYYNQGNFRDTNWPEIGAVSGKGLSQAIERSCSGIVEQCRKARYFYLKGALREGLNLEVNQDKTAVETYLHQFGFTPSLVDTLNEAERLYHLQGTPFDSKNSLGHLRSFLENVQKEAMPRVHAKYGGNLSLDWGGGLAYLAKNDVLSKAEELFVMSLYRLISDEGVHPLIAQREYVRLARNMVIEYALLFLTKMDKLGFRTIHAKLP
jgi:hypothetical protein